MKKFQLVCLSILAGTFFSMSALAAPQPLGLDSIIATVNDTAITSSQLNSQIEIAVQQLEAAHQPIPSRSVLKQKVLQKMIDQQLEMQAAKKMGIVVSNADVDKTIAAIAQQNNLSSAQLIQAVTQQGLKETTYRNEIHDEMVINQVQQKEIGPRVGISKQEVKDFMDTHRNDLQKVLAPPAPPTNQNSNPAVHVETLIVPAADASAAPAALKNATQIVKQLQGGADFQKIATSTVGLQSNVQASDLGWKYISQLPDLYISYLKNAKPNQIIGPIHAPNGYHILKVVEVHGMAPPTTSADTTTLNTEEVHVRHIIIKTTPVQNDAQVKARLELIRANIIGGGDFSKAAFENSQDPGSVGAGGDLGWVTSEGLDPAFAKVMLQTKVGEVSEPFKSQFGWHILQVLGKRDVKDKQTIMDTRIKQLIYQRKADQALHQWLGILRASSYIKIFDDNGQ